MTTPPRDFPELTRVSSDASSLAPDMPVRTTSGTLPQALRSLMIALVLAVGSWWLFIDPQWGVLQVYGNPANAFIFWALFAVVCLAFNLELWGFNSLPQPWAGTLFMVAVLGFALSVTLFLAHVWGAVDHSFSASRADGVGYFAGAIFVLFAFMTNVPASTNFEHQPWVRLGLRQPWVGLIEIAVAALASALVYAAFATPVLSEWSQTSPWLSLTDMIGYFYCIVVVILLTANHTENWPWSLARPRTIVWLPGVVVMGAALFFILKAIAGLILGGTAWNAIGSGTGIYASEVGVCWVFWSIFWANCADNWPTHGSPFAQAVTRVAVTLLLGVGTFAAYYHVIAGTVLHEPLIAGNVHGEALGFVDWLIVWLLISFVGFGGWPFNRAAVTGDATG